MRRARRRARSRPLPPRRPRRTTSGTVPRRPRLGGVIGTVAVMPSFRTGRVVALLEDRPGLQRVEVALGEGGRSRAYALTEQVGPLEVGDRVVLNTTAIELGLGTGGWHVVHWNLTRTEWRQPGPGHVMKARYTSVQS